MRANQESIHDHYEFIKKIDEGAFGYVFKAMNKRTKEIVAIKKMKQLYSNIEEAFEIKEVKVILQMDHPNIVKIKDVKFYDQTLYIIYEYLVTDLLKFYTYYNDQVNLSEDLPFRSFNKKYHYPDRPRT